MYRNTPPPQSLSGARSFWADLFLVGAFFFFLYFFIAFARHWVSPLQTAAEIDLSFWSLPKYAMYSLSRALIAYMISLGFTLVVGFIAAKSVTAERMILPMLDIGQSIPVLGFLPGLVLGLISVFPESNLGLELACILMIFTGQVWNMTFSYYSSLKAVPTQFHELGKVLRLKWFRKLVEIELPYSMTNLAWNSLMSMAGGWFFLTVCESFKLRDKDFRIPGLGSYMQAAIENRNTPAMFAGIGAMIAVIITVDFFLWRPILAWSQKFRLEDAQDQTKDIPFVVLLMRDSKFVRWLFWYFQSQNRDGLTDLAKRNVQKLGPLVAFEAELFKRARQQPWYLRIKKLFPSELTEKLPYVLTLIILVTGVIYGYEVVRPLTADNWREIGIGTLATAARVMAALVLASLWAVPVGIWIGSSPRLTRFFQPIIQIAASFPAPMIFPLALLVLTRAGITLGWGSIVLMLLGVQWYVLFNVLAGASTISRELRDTVRLMGVSNWSRWTKLYLPSVFPALVTGWITAAGGAWNASIVSEYVQYGGQTLVTAGLGSLISQATTVGNFPMLAGCLLAMCGTVITLNRSVWRVLYRIAENRFRYDR